MKRTPKAYETYPAVPAIASIRAVMDLIQQLYQGVEDEDERRELMRRHCRYAIAARSAELGISQKQLKEINGVSLKVVDKDRFSSEDSLAAYLRMGCRVEHFLDFGNVFAGWPQDCVVRMFAGTHIAELYGRGDGKKERVASWHDIKAVTDFSDYLQQSVPINFRVNIDTVDAPLRSDSEEFELEKLINKKSKTYFDYLWELDKLDGPCTAVFSFGAPDTCITTGILANHMFPNSRDTSLRLIINHAKNQLGGADDRKSASELFQVRKTDEDKSHLLLRGKKYIPRTFGKNTVEDYALVGVSYSPRPLNPEQRISVLGFGAGISHWGTLCSSGAIRHLLTDLFNPSNGSFRYQKIMSQHQRGKSTSSDSDITDMHTALGLIRVVVKEEDGMLKVPPQNPELTFESTDPNITGWNFVDKALWT